MAAENPSSPTTPPAVRSLVTEEDDPEIYISEELMQATWSPKSVCIIDENSDECSSRTSHASLSLEEAAQSDIGDAESEEADTRRLACNLGSASQEERGAIFTGSATTSPPASPTVPLSFSSTEILSPDELMQQLKDSFATSPGGSGSTVDLAVAKVFELAVAMRPSERGYKTLLQMAEWLSDEGQHTKAVTCLQKAVDCAPYSCIRARFRLGNQMFTLQKFEEAARHFSEVAHLVRRLLVLLCPPAPE
ncbi:hypothetical protein CYMTET_32487, partial [Cymbomonas tetramitiformis]